MKVDLRGIKHEVKFVKGMSSDCAGKWWPGVIHLRHTLAGRNLMQIALHEALHGCQVDLNEDAVEAISLGLTDMLWALGYRRVEIA